MNTIDVALRAHEDNRGVFWNLHMRKKDGSGVTLPYDQKPTNGEIRQACQFLNGDMPCEILMECDLASK